MQMLTKTVTIQKYNYWKIVSVGVTVSNYVKKVQRMQAADRTPVSPQSMHVADSCHRG